MRVWANYDYTVWKFVLVIDVYNFEIFPTRTFGERNKNNKYVITFSAYKLVFSPKT